MKFIAHEMKNILYICMNFTYMLFNSFLYSINNITYYYILYINSKEILMCIIIFWYLF